MAKEASFKHKVKELTFYQGKLYQPGETIEFTGADAVVAAEYYGQKVDTQADDQSAAKKLAENVKANKAAGAE